MSTVVLDTITGKSTATTITIGSTPVVSASANSMTIRGEGTAQTSIQQGLAKAWGMFDMTLSSSHVLDSFNNGSYTDHEAGECTFTFTTSFGNANYSVGNTTARCAGTDSRLYTQLNFEYELDNSGTAPATGSLRICAGRIGTSGDNPARTDLARASLNFFGDLA